MGFLASLATGVVTWLLEKGSIIIVSWYKARSRVSKRERVIDDEVRAVAIIRNEMLARRKAKLPRDPKLEREMKYALRNLNIKFKSS